MAKTKNALYARYVRDNLGPNLHTALRKCCDSTPTSAAWNLIGGMIGPQWSAYLDDVWKALDGKTFKTHYDVALAVRRASLDIELAYKAESSLRMALYCIFKLFTPDEWAGYTTYLVVEKSKYTGFKDNEKHDPYSAEETLYTDYLYFTPKG